MVKIPRIFLPAIVGVSVYLLVNKLFPEKISDLNSEEGVISGDSIKDLKGGDLVKNSLVRKIVQKIRKDSAIKLGILTVFATAGGQYFNEEIKKLLLDDIFKEICLKENKGQLKIVCDIIKENELNLHTKSIKKLIVAKHISQEDKINLLKIKLDFIINGQCAGKKRFLVVSIVALLASVCFSGVTGLALFLEALYRLFQEGKISQVLYEEILNNVT